MGRTSGNRSHQDRGDLDDGAVSGLGVGDVVDAVEFQDVLVILLLEQQDVLFEEDHVEVHVFLALGSPHESSFVNKAVLRELKILKKEKKTKSRPRKKKDACPPFICHTCLIDAGYPPGGCSCRPP